MLVAVAIAIAVLVKTFLVQPFYIPSESMEKTLHGCPGCSGDRILVNKLIYDFRDPHPGDIVVFHAPSGWDDEPAPRAPANPLIKSVRGFGQLVGFVPPDESDLVKRVIATGGQSVQCCDSQGRVQVSDNGERGPWRSLNEQYIFENSDWDSKSRPGHLSSGGGDQRTFGPVTIPKGRLWVMGDHRGDSADSRFHCIEEAPVDHICGTANSTVAIEQGDRQGDRHRLAAVALAHARHAWHVQARRRRRIAGVRRGPDRPPAVRASPPAPEALVGELVPRVGGRLLLIDPQGRVLLIHERTEEGDSTVWLAPGGGVEPGEAPLQAAVREVYEETGIRADLPTDAPEVKRLRRVWRSHAITYDQTEIFFVARVTAGLAVEPASLTLDEQQTVLGSRWWTAAELQASDETFEPAEMVELIASATTIRRIAGRVLLLDADDRLLLIENLVDVGATSTHWVTPGGGAEPGETPAQAAVRELFEETGVRIDLPDDATPFYVDRETFTFNGRAYDQSNYHFVGKLGKGTSLRVAGVDRIEQSVLVGERWWTLDELRATTAVVYPIDLADVLSRLLSDDQAASA